MLSILATVLLSAAPALPPIAETPPPVSLPVDVETRVNGVDIACTGVDAGVRAEPRWRAYGVRVELSNRRNEYLVDGVVTVRDAAGRALLSARCDAPWVLLRLDPGAYLIEATMDGALNRPSARVVAPRVGQLRVVLQFTEF